MKITLKFNELILVILIALSILTNMVLIYGWKMEVIKKNEEIFDWKMTCRAQQDIVYQAIARKQPKTGCNR